MAWEPVDYDLLAETVEDIGMGCLLPVEYNKRGLLNGRMLAALWKCLWGIL